MEPYLLTQEDIDKLLAAGGSDAMPGEAATPQDLQLLGITPEPMPEVTDDRSPGGNLAVETVPAPPAVTPVTAPANNNMALLQQMLDAQKPAQPFSYESMSKDQRRMLAFAGLSDAGRALQGMQGGKLEALLGRFNEQADIQRKATAAAAQRQMLQGLVGGGVGADPQARIQQLLNLAMVNPSMAPAIALQVKNIQDQLQGSTKDVTGSSQAATQLEDVNALINMIDADPSLTTGIMGSLLSYIPGTGANIAEGLATTLRSNLALQALKDLKATGATMGALNATEFTALETELTQLDLSKGPQTSKRALKRIQTKYQNLVADAFRDAEEQAAAGNPIGQKTLEGLSRIFGGKPAWTENAGPVVPSGTQREGESDEDFLKRMREGRG